MQGGKGGERFSFPYGTMPILILSNQGGKQQEKSPKTQAGRVLQVILKHFGKTSQIYTVSGLEG